MHATRSTCPPARRTGSNTLAAAALLAAGAAPLACLAQTTTLPAGSAPPQAVSTYQPSLALHMFIARQGFFGIGVPIRMFAFSDSFVQSLSGNWMETDGRLLQISQNQALFAQLGTNYGGNGVQTFAIPDLRGRVMAGWSGAGQPGAVIGTPTVTLTAANLPEHTHAYPHSPTGATRAFPTPGGGGAPISNVQPSLVVNPLIVTSGVYPFNGDGVGGAGPDVLDGWYSQVIFGASSSYTGVENSRMPLRGQVLPISSNSALFSLIYNAYGGNGQTTFQLPDLSGRIAMHASPNTTGVAGPTIGGRLIAEAFGAQSVTLTAANLPPHTHAVGAPYPATGSTGAGAPFSRAQPTLTLRYFISTEGVFPGNSMADDTPFIGEVFCMAAAYSTYYPANCLPCEGQLLPVAGNEALYVVMGTAFGGDGVNTFRLPDLRGRVPMGAQNGVYPAGMVLGAAETTLTLDTMPAHAHALPCRADLGRQGGVQGPDGALDNNDFIVFISRFFDADPLADVGRQGGLT
ncbi:MAG: tail fiber protein, partial [Phycisphaerales bacterium]|nr:tail fiber protein [Phycisphaerales bacterium]